MCCYTILIISGYEANDLMIRSDIIIFAPIKHLHFKLDIT